MERSTPLSDTMVRSAPIVIGELKWTFVTLRQFLSSLRRWWQYFSISIDKARECFAGSQWFCLTRVTKAYGAVGCP